MVQTVYVLCDEVKVLRSASPGLVSADERLKPGKGVVARIGDSPGDGVAEASEVHAPCESWCPAPSEWCAKPSKADLGEPHPTLWVTKRCYAAFGRDAGTGEDDQTLASGDELGGLSQACLGDASALKGGGGGLHASALLAALHFCVVREEEKT